MDTNHWNLGPEKGLLLLNTRTKIHKRKEYQNGFNHPLLCK